MATPTQENGIFDGFEGYQTPTADQYIEVLRNGLVSFDANVLLDLYRYNGTARADLFAIMRSLGERVWVSHQCLEEFWRNRTSAMNDAVGTARSAKDEIEDAQVKLSERIRTWANRVGLADEEKATLVGNVMEALGPALEAVRERIDEHADSAEETFSLDTNKDPVVIELASILSGRIGPRPSDEWLEAARQEGTRRVQAKEPPGYRDSGKGERASGDYLVWGQLIVEAATRDHDAILVTSDKKDDWWRKEGGAWLGPRIELVDEFRRETGRRIFLLDPKLLFQYAKASLDVPVDPKSVSEAERVDRLRGTFNSPDTRDAIVAAMYRKAHELDWTALSNAEKTRQYREWVEDPEVGGVLSADMSEDQIRVWMKDRPMKEYIRALEGIGPYAQFAVERYEDPQVLIRTSLGDDWDVIEGSTGEKPMHCRVANGKSQRYVCWGRPGTFRDLIHAALGNSGAEDDRALVIVTTFGNEELRDIDELTRTASRANVDIDFVSRQLVPNPDYQG
ncbi:PIN-like domain-containing protein [Nocardia aurantiaca]|uniref:PIN like domain-containing protein n=1 Tax=Nocardia aurantiaca TaxID=2675850 RepID=A0A6I3KZW1_9NOCA|nr:PIN-like domain-containing protein [Nocardia aurantiaca]MTE16263.1 hypothetical protein [Nocardia aurantiaca]